MPVVNPYLNSYITQGGNTSLCHSSLYNNLPEETNMGDTRGVYTVNRYICYCQPVWKGITHGRSWSKAWKLASKPFVLRCWQRYKLLYKPYYFIVQVGYVTLTNSSLKAVAMQGVWNAFWRRLWQSTLSRSSLLHLYCTPIGETKKIRLTI